MTVEQHILEKIKAFETIIIHRHMRPDPDAIGSQLGLKAIIANNFPEKKVLAAGGALEGLSYLGQMDEVDDEMYEGALVIVVDTANTPRVSDDRFNRGAFLIKIDHHPNDEPYGDIVHVNTTVSSCAELITQLAITLELTLNDEAARLLYAGIVGDTGRFLYPSTSANTLQIASILRTYDFDASKLLRQIESISFDVAKLSGYVYEHLEVDENGAGRVMISNEVLEQFGLKDFETSHIVQLPGMIDAVQSWGIFVQQPNGKYRVRLRSKTKPINEIAKRHNGGGHPLASGANAKDIQECHAIYKELQALVQYNVQ